jgi:hypothetical protein
MPHQVSIEVDTLVLGFVRIGHRDNLVQSAAD